MLFCVPFFTVWVRYCFQSRLARLVVGPFCGWNCTGGRPSVHCNTTNYFFLKTSKHLRLDWVTFCGWTDWCHAYTDEVVFGEAAGCDVILQELLGKVLVHLSCLVRIHGVSTSLVQICWEKKKIIANIELHVGSCWPQQQFYIDWSWTLLSKLPLNMLSLIMLL